MVPVFRSLMAAVLLANVVSAAEIFVDNQLGRDSNDGLVPTIAEGTAGPVRTFARAVRIANYGDAIVIKNNGIPYYESISLMGNRHSGSLLRPFTVQGNGATISGLRTVNKDGWREVAPKLWMLNPTRKGYYQFLRDGRLLTEFRLDDGSNPLDVLPAAQWVSYRGSVYFRQDGPYPPDQQNFACTADQTGISLHSVSNVLILDLKLEHFRFDGLHAHGLCDRVELSNVSAVENGRGGIVSSGKSTIHIYGGEIARNGRHEILTNDRSIATRHQTQTTE